MDRLFAMWMGRVIDAAARQHERGVCALPEPTDKLKLLFAGYNGTRNTGSDVRVEEMLRQVRQLFGADRVETTVFSFIKEYSAGYFGDSRQIAPPSLFPRFLAQEVPRHHGVIACEGSTFKSKFTDLLTVLMVGALGVATAHDRLSIAYGAEAGYMNPWPKWLTAEYCKKSLIITRNEESRGVLADLGIPSEFGTDTAWTFSPLGNEYAKQELRKVGWNGERVLLVCPINPFWWPVKVSLLKGVTRLFGFNRRNHYGSIFFFTWNNDVREQFDRYLSALARAVEAFRRRTGVFVVAAASEELDNHAMQSFSEKMGGVPTFSSSHHNMYQLVSIFRGSDMLLSSRYHAIVTSMAGNVASAGVTMDERIANLMKDRGHEHLLMTVNDPDLESKALAALDYLDQHTEEVATRSRQTVAKHLRIMSGMGRRMVEFVSQKYPNFESANRLQSWEDYLPPPGAGTPLVVGRASPLGVTAGGSLPIRMFLKFRLKGRRLS